MPSAKRSRFAISGDLDAECVFRDHTGRVRHRPTLWTPPFSYLFTARPENLAIAAARARDCPQKRPSGELIPSAGPVFYEHGSEHPFLGHNLASESATSDATVHMIEQEARAVLVKTRQDAEQVVKARRPQLERLVGELLAHENIDKANLERILGDKTASL